MTLTRRSVSGALLTAAVACNPAPPTPESFTACYARFVPGEEPVADLVRLTRACGPLGGVREQAGDHALQIWGTR